MWPSDAIWWHKSGTTLTQVMACCLMAPNHYLNQCWLNITEVWWHSPESNFIVQAQDICPWSEFENYKFKVIVTSLRSKWVNQRIEYRSGHICAFRATPTYFVADPKRHQWLKASFLKHQLNSSRYRTNTWSSWCPLMSYRKAISRHKADNKVRHQGSFCVSAQPMGDDVIVTL